MATSRRRLTRRDLVRNAGVAAAGIGGAAGPRRSQTARRTPAAGDVLVYSGRRQDLVEDLFPLAEAATGLEIGVRYGGSAEMAATIIEEGENSPADLFFTTESGALGALAAAERLRPLPGPLLGLVPERFRSGTGRWVGTSGRVRVAIYNPELIDGSELPGSILDLTLPSLKGRIGWAPENGPFQDFITALRLVEGEDGARAWLRGMVENETEQVGDNSALVTAVAAGEIAVGLVNHYYLYEFRAEVGPDVSLANHFFAPGDIGGLVNVAGVGVVDTARNGAAALALAEYLVGPEAQAFFAERTWEYPVIEGIPIAPGLEPLAEVRGPEIDLDDLGDLDGTLELLMEVGLL